MIPQSSDLIIYLITISFTGTILFCIINILDKSQKKFKAQWIYNIYKSIMVFLTIPAFLIVSFLLVSNFKIINVAGEDFISAQVIKNQSFATILHGGIGNSIIFLIMLMIWLFGFVLVFIFQIIKEMVFLKNLYKVSICCNDPDMNVLIHDISKTHNIKKVIPVYRNNIIDTPFITGLIRPKIFLPCQNYNQKTLRLFIEHEVIHFKQHDILYKLIIMFFKGMHWFNPYVHYIVRVFNESCELACDEILLVGADKKTRICYAHAITQILVSEQSIINICFNDNVDSIKRRLELIMRVKQEYSRKLMLVITFALIILCPLTAYGTTSAAIVMQDSIVRKIAKQHSIEETSETFDDYTESVVLISDIPILYTLTSTRGSNLIDIDLDENSQLVMESLYLSASSKVQFVISGTTSDTFRAGIIDSNNRVRYVSSQKGTISYTFNITKADDYVIYVESTTNSTIHLTGSVYIK